MGEEAVALYAQIRAIGARPPSPDTDTRDPFLQAVIANQTIVRCRAMAELMARARALGAEPPADVLALMEVAAADNKEAVDLRATAEERIARITVASRYIVDGIERLEAHSNKPNRLYTAIRNWESPLNQIPREQLVTLVRRMVAEAASTGAEPPEDVLAIVQRIENAS